MNTDRSQTTAARRAFTLIELMVVIAIIGLLVAVLLPTFDAVRNNAKKATVTAQFQAIDQGLNLFQNEKALGGSLPPSGSDKRDSPGDFQIIGNPRLEGGGNEEVRIAGAHLLYHALVGADQLGPPGFRDLDRDGQWWNDTTNKVGNPGGLYEMDPITGQVVQTRYGSGGFVEDKMKERAKSLADLEGNGIALNLASTPDLAVDELMFVDAWDMPILYYRANSYNVRMTTNRSNVAGIFRQEDNGAITGTENGIVASAGVDFGAGQVSGRYHAIALAESPDPIVTVEDIQTLPDYDDSFARFILNGSVTTRPTPVRKESFLLISAGPDGRYGTEDDMTNWTRKTE